jgi:sec-independent protein translocase protein TatC
MSELHGISQHIAELRTRITRIAIVIIVIIAIILTCKLEPLVYNGITLYYPVPEPINNIASQITNHMREELVPKSVQLIQTAPGQAFYAQMYVAFITGLVLSMPIIIRELTAFIRPALKEREIKATRAIAIPALILFVIGAIFAYFTVIPFMLNFLYQYGQASGLVTFLNVIDFVSFVLQFLLAFGVAFQLPLVMYAATVSGITDASFWRRNIRYAVVALVIIGAIVTPDGSGVTMWFISGPMIALYLAGMAIIERREFKIKRV